MLFFLTDIFKALTININKGRSVVGLSCITCIVKFINWSSRGGFIAQSVEQRTGIAEVMGSNLVEASDFFLGFLCNCLSYFTTAKITFTSITCIVYTCFRQIWNKGTRGKPILCLYGMTTITKSQCCHNYFHIVWKNGQHKNKFRAFGPGRWFQFIFIENRTFPLRLAAFGCAEQKNQLTINWANYIQDDAKNCWAVSPKCYVYN